jgi:hypothetical protein
MGSVLVGWNNRNKTEIVAQEEIDADIRVLKIRLIYNTTVQSIQRRAFDKFSSRCYTLN